MRKIVEVVCHLIPLFFWPYLLQIYLSKVCFFPLGLPVPCQTLYNQLQGILNDETPPSPHPLGCLTGLDRDRWARLRVMLGHENLDQLEAIDSALFVLCLDDVAPTSPETLTHQMLHNYGRNRSVGVTYTTKAHAA